MPKASPSASRRSQIPVRSTDDLNGSLSTAGLVVVGSGLYGLTVAERAASELGIEVVVVERRPHPGGNSWSHRDPATGIEIHDYGSHLFHTNNPHIWNYVQKFTEFNDYRHFVMAMAASHVYPMPINLQTINSFYGKAWSPSEARKILGLRQADGSSATSLEERAIELVGEALYDTFIKGYTRKQWQTDPRELPADIISRLPFRLDYQSGYFKDSYQGLPLEGYEAWILRMLDNPRISLFLETDYFDVQGEIPGRTPIVYTGALDKFFNYKYGPLGWRTLDFTIETIDVADFQGCAVMNYCDVDVPWTRIHEFRHLHPERHYDTGSTVIMREFSRFATIDDEPYYPINSAKDKHLMSSYLALCAKEPRVHFGGRLGTYRYLDMHMAIGAALRDFGDSIGPRISRT